MFLPMTRHRFASTLWIVCFLVLALTPPAGAGEEDVLLEISSEERDGLLIAAVSGRFPYPIEELEAALATPEGWCEFVPLTLNVKACSWSGERENRQLSIYAGRKEYQAPEDAFRIDYRFAAEFVDEDRFRVALQAPEGPFGTRDYLIRLEARRDGEGTLVHLLSSFRPSLASRLATRAYLSTLGRGKVGFSTLADGQGEEKTLVRGVKGIVERNAMRYYLALQTFLETREVPPEGRFAFRASAWFDHTEAYAEQLHEVEKEAYLNAKEREHQNQLRLQALPITRMAAHLAKTP